MFNNIIVNRIGKTPNSFMITKRIIKTISPNIKYKFLPKNLLPIPDYYGENTYANSFSKSHLRFAIVDGLWSDEKFIVNDKSNILGSNGKFTTDSHISIPLNVASAKNVEYYGAKLIEIFNIFDFQAKEDLPLTEVIIGDDYIKDFIEVEELGGGNYLEYHDNPHFHAPMNIHSNGHIILGKKINENKYHLSAFIIPMYYGLYTPGFVIHNDSYLLGDWMVVYSKTDNYSTVLLRDKNNNITKFSFI
jgi:hypothetical protein